MIVEMFLSFENSIINMPHSVTSLMAMAVKMGVLRRTNISTLIDMGMQPAHLHAKQAKTRGQYDIGWYVTHLNSVVHCCADCLHFIFIALKGDVNLF